MRAENAVVSEWARKITREIVQMVTNDLQSMGCESMLSGDDSCLETVWEEICVQVQIEESIYWDTYLEVVESFISSHVEVLSKEEILALWLKTDSGWNWAFDNHADENGEKTAPVCFDEVVSNIKESVLDAALDFENDRIYNYITGCDEEDEEDDHRGEGVS
jgi:hypothetical protein